MFTLRKITPTIVAWDCASCGKAMVEASYILEGVSRTGRPTTVGYVCAACAIWARSWTPPAGAIVAERLTDEEIATLAAEKAEPLPMNRIDAATAERSLAHDRPDISLEEWRKQRAVPPAGVETGRRIIFGDRVILRAAPQGATPDDEKILVGLRAGNSIDEIAKILHREPWEVDYRAEVLCPEPRDATTIGAALKRVREAATA